jgi:hypothetical protein
MRPSVTLEALRDTTQLFLPFIKKSLALLLGLFLLIECMQQYFLFLAQMAQELQSINWPAIVGQLLSSLLEFVTLTMLIPLNCMILQKEHPQMGFFEFSKKHLHGLTVESLRALAMTLIWTMALILPGLFKYVRYMFVPYVVVSEPEYYTGQVDALEKSNQLVKGYTFQLVIILVVLTATELLRGSLREQFPLFQNPVPAIALAAGFYAFNIFTNILLFRVYQLRLKGWRGANNGINV